MTLVIGVILATLLLGYILVVHDWEKDGKPKFAIVKLMIVCVFIGIYLGLNDTKTYKKPLKPTKVRVECVNVKCDTSYVYVFKD